MSPAARVVAVILVLAAGAGGYMWWRGRPTPVPPVPPPVTRPASSGPIVQPQAPPDAGIRHPVESGVSKSGPLPAIDESDAYFKDALGNLLGRKGVVSFLAIDEFARRFVATVNNLATDNTAAELWPVKRTGGQLVADERGGGSVLSAKNGERYTPFVRFAEAVDTQKAVSLYRRVYPLLQRAYEDLGYPGRYFNDRVVEVIDHLLTTPDVSEPIRIRHVAADGSSKPMAGGAGGLYLFDDPMLEASSSGRKIMLRMGKANAAKLKAKLEDVRKRIVK